MLGKLRKILGSRKSSRRSPGREPFQLQFERLEERALLSAVSITDASINELANLSVFVPGNVAVLQSSADMAFGPSRNADPADDLYVVGHASNNIVVYDGQTGAFVEQFVGTGAGLESPAWLAFGPDGDLYIPTFTATGKRDAILRVDQATKAVSTFVSGASSGLVNAKGLAFGPDGNLYVVDAATDQVRRYDGTTGAFIDAFVAQGSGGLDFPGNVLFGSDRNNDTVSDLYVSSVNTDEVLVFSGADGTPLGAFVTAGSGGLDVPHDMAFGADGHLYVVNFSTTSPEVYRFDGTTGAFIDIVVPPSGGLGTGISYIAFDGQGNLYVSNPSAHEVRRYDAGPLVSLSPSSTDTVTVDFSTANGTAVAGGDYRTLSGQLTFAPGETSKRILVSAVDDALTEGTETFVVDLSNPSAGVTINDGQGVITIQDNSVERPVSISDATSTEGANTPHFRQAFVTEGSGGLKRPRSLTFRDGYLYVPDETRHAVYRYDAQTGAFIDEFVSAGASGGLDRPSAAAFGPDGNLYVVSFTNNAVYRYNGTSGAFIDIFVTSGSGGLANSNDLAFDSAGNLYLTTDLTAQVLRYDTNGDPFPGPLGAAGTAVFVPTGSGGLVGARGVVFDGSGNLYVASIGDDRVLKYSGSTGAFLGEFVIAGSGGLDQPHSMTFGPDGNLYVGSANLNSVYRYAGANGQFIDVFVPSGSGGLANTLGLAFDDNGRFYAASGGGAEVLQYSTESEAVFTVTLATPSSSPTTVNYSTANGSAVAGSDYVTATGTVLFQPGVTARSIFVPLVNDTVFETNESFVVNLSNPSPNALIADGQGVGTILDNDPPPTKFFVVNDGSPDRTYEYAAGGAAIENYALNAGNTAPRGAASTTVGDKVWVVDNNRNVYVYNTSGGLLGSWTAGTMNASAQPQGIATDGTDVWIVDAKSDKVFRYAGAASLLSGSQNAASSFSLNSGNKNPTDIVTDGTSLWVTNDSTANKVFKYTTGGALLGSWSIDAANATPTGITIDPASPSTIWIVDSGTDKIYEYTAAASRTSGSQSAATSYALAAGNTNPQGLADPPSEAVTLRVTEQVGRLSRAVQTGQETRPTTHSLRVTEHHAEHDGHVPFGPREQGDQPPGIAKALAHVSDGAPAHGLREHAAALEFFFSRLGERCNGESTDGDGQELVADLIGAAEEED
jgi:hypothetical protein